jgi:hypothetical protein
MDKRVENKKKRKTVLEIGGGTDFGCESLEEYYAEKSKGKLLYRKNSKCKVIRSLNE